MDYLTAAFNIAHAVMHVPAFRAAVEGAGVAAMMDYRAFQTWKSFDDVLAYSWKTALFRWLQGAIIGLTMAGGFWAL